MTGGRLSGVDSARNQDYFLGLLELEGAGFITSEQMLVNGSLLMG